LVTRFKSDDFKKSGRAKLNGHAWPDDFRTPGAFAKQLRHF
jgi:hypothetical protein